MRIFYIGKLREGTTSLARMTTLNDLGHAIVPFNISAFEAQSPRIVQSIAWRLNAGPMVRAINRALQREVKNLKGGIDLIWVEKGVWIYPETLQAFKEATGARVLHYTPDAQFVIQRSRHFLASIPLYDVFVTTKEWEVDAYKQAGAKRVLLTYQGYDSRFYPRAVSDQERTQYASDVCFIGHTQPHYAQRLKALSTIGIQLRIWGNAWPAYAKRHPWARGLVNSGLWGESYPVALSCAKIGLGLLGKHIPETSTTRSFEIPATGTFLLAERTALHQQLFEEGKEAEFFSSDDEMIDKVKFYLAHDEARRRIAAAGRARCERSGYSSLNLLRKILEDLESGDRS